MKYQTLNTFLEEYKNTISPNLVLDFLENYFKEIYPIKFCDSFYCNSKLDENYGLFLKFVLHGDYFAESATAYPFDLKTSITDSKALVIAWRKFLNSLFPNYKQAYKEHFLKKQEEKIEEDLLEF